MAKTRKFAVFQIFAVCYFIVITHSHIFSGCIKIGNCGYICIQVPALYQKVIKSILLLSVIFIQNSLPLFALTQDAERSSL
jgi:hypothetical protein